jgi:hypothetical protein
MDTFNRIVVLLLGLALLIGALATLTAPSWLSETTVTLAPEIGPSLFWGAILVAAISALVMLMEVWPRRRRVFESNIEGAVVEYPASSVRESVDRDLEALPGVRHAHSQVEMRRGGGVDMRLTVETEGAQDPQVIANRAAARAREKLERGLGLRVDRLRLAVRPGGFGAPWRRHADTAVTEETTTVVPRTASDESTVVRDYSNRN